jgi:AcrR family transcriptional regulator
MRRLSERLGVALGATYHYVPNRQALMRLVVNDIVQDLELPARDDPHVDWVEQTRVALMAYVGLMAQYPGLAAEMLVDLENTRPVVFHDYLVERLVGAGFTEERIGAVLAVLFFFVSGVTLAGVQAAAGSPGAHPRFDEFVDSGLRMLLRGLAAELDHDRAGRHP